MTKDYSKSRFENETAERAYETMLEGLADDSIGSVEEDNAFDLVTVDGRHVIIHPDSQGFVWIFYEETHHSVDHARTTRVWDELRENVNGEGDPDNDLS